MLLSGIFLGLVVGVVFLARMNAIESDGTLAMDDPDVHAAVDRRLEPIGSLIYLGDDELAAAAVATVTPTPVATVLSGPQVYNEACYLCHTAPGVGGAPVVGDTEAWAERITQGLAILNDHAINGYQGSAGVMPAKGGRVDLSDAEIESAVIYMLDELGVDELGLDELGLDQPGAAELVE
jgi:cytochrome c5